MFFPNFVRPGSLGVPFGGEDGYSLTLDVPIPMRDGARLATDLYLPAATGVYPVLLERTPYGKHQSVMVNIGAPQYLARNGFIVAIQDARGRYASEGSWYPFRDEAWGECRDGYDTVEWLAGQPWCNGKVGVFGGSFAGFNQVLLAGNMPPHLAAAFPRQAPSSLHREWVYRGGALELAFIVLMFGGRQSAEPLRHRLTQLDQQSLGDPASLLNGFPVGSHPLLSNPFDWLDDYLHRQEDEGYWKQWDVEPYYASFAVPTCHMTSWFDIFLSGTLRNFVGMRAQAKSEEIRKQHRLIIGPWLHGPSTDQAPQGRIAGEIDFGEAAFWNFKAAMLRWFDCWLKGIPNAVSEERAVHYFVMGLNRWRTADDWPPPGIQYRKLYLTGRPSNSSKSLYDGSLVSKPAEESIESVKYLHDPGDPVPSVGGNTLYFLAKKEWGQAPSWDDLNAQAGSRDQRVIEDQCLTFSSQPLEEDVEVTGPVTANLYVSSSAVDTDFVVRLCDVHPDGRSMLICDGIQRARYRESSFNRSLLQPGKVYSLTVDLWSTSHLFRKRHRIRVVINSSCFPRYDVNPGTGESGAKATNQVTAENRIYLEQQHPSHLNLPIMNSNLTL